MTGGRPTEVVSAAGDYTLLIILNADQRRQPEQIPPADGARRRHRVFDTSLACGLDGLDVGAESLLVAAEYCLVNPCRTVVLLGKQPRGWRQRSSP